MSVKVDFEVLVDTSLSTVCSSEQLKTALNKRFISLINDYEDGKWRFAKFQTYLWDNIAQTALSQRERDSLAGKSHSQLVEAARNLRFSDADEVGEGSEIAEIFLYGFMKDHFGALPVVPKIFYKQNAQDNAKGADSVHIVVKDDDFTLWFGEAKFYNSIEDKRLDSIVTSVLKSLQTDKLKKENIIVTNVSDIYQLPIGSDLQARIVAAIRPKESIDKLKSRINVPIMILHECDITSKHIDLTDSYRKLISSHHMERVEAYYKKQIAKSTSVFKYSDVKFHVILFPVPNKQAIVKAFVSGVQFYKSQG
jgi:hypothetical protein